MLITTETPAAHGITIFDDNLKPLQRVQTFDTETFLCTESGGARSVAAGYVIAKPSPKIMCVLAGSFPDSVLEHVFPEIIDSDDPDQPDRIKRFCARQLDHRKVLMAQCSTPEP